MGVEPVTYYTATCDKCGRNVLDEDEYSAYSDLGDLRRAILGDYGGKVWGEQVVCSHCIYPYWSKLDGEDWDALHDDEPEAVAKARAALDLPTPTGAQA